MLFVIFPQLLIQTFDEIFHGVMGAVVDDHEEFIAAVTSHHTEGIADALKNAGKIF